MTEATFKQRERAARAQQERREHLLQIPYDYAAFLENGPRAYLVNTRLLPHPKEEIVRAILFSIANAKEKSQVSLLSHALMTLAMAQDIGSADTLSPPNPDEFNDSSDQIQLHRFKAALDNYSATSQRHLESVNRDLALFRNWATRAVAANEHMWSPLKKWWVRLTCGDPVVRQVPAEWIDFPDLGPISLR